MTTAITDKTEVLVLRGDIKIYLNQEEAKKVYAIMENKGIEAFEIQDRKIMRYAIQYVVPAGDIEIQERIKRGEWKCEKGHWNSKVSRKCEGEGQHCYY